MEFLELLRAVVAASGFWIACVFTFDIFAKSMAKDQIDGSLIFQNAFGWTLFVSAMWIF